RAARRARGRSGRTVHGGRHPARQRHALPGRYRGRAEHRARAHQGCSHPMDAGPARSRHVRCPGTGHDDIRNPWPWCLARSARRVMLGGEASVLAIALAAGSALLATPLPAAAVTRLAAGVSTITLGREATVVVFLDQNTSGARLLLLSDESIAVDDGQRQVQL